MTIHINSIQVTRPSSFVHECGHGLGDYQPCRTRLRLFSPAAGRLTLDDLADVQVAAWDARDVWYNVGIQLHVSVPTLKSIRGENLGNNGACLTEVLTEWLKGIDPVPTWTGLAEALKQPTVSQPRLAAEIEGRYLNLARLDDSTVNTSGVNADVEGPSTCTVPKLSE